MRKRAEITLQTKQNFMDAFWELYCERGIEKITVKDVTRRAGYNRSTFYEYFTDTYNVLEQIEEQLIPTIETLPEVNLPSGGFGTPVDQVMDIYESNRKYYSVLLGDKGDPAFAGKLKNAIKPALQAAFDDRTVSEKVRLDYVLEYILNAMIGVMSYWYSQPDPLPREQLYALMYQLMEEGALKQFH